ncbi:hypothetical protein [Streptomyces litchfieldiae]|uniref:Lipoprotein n=1 Tax=Streptomyces litchfieldiae TaxID=3075543 RepID=A0ABU2MJL5_9ACTN|nr:hypothetical protein [Streptomyces sp. DSM 44938]MDT0341797.1 hypothetical protein [Streptomyces sp. DSM 44938]
MRRTGTTLATFLATVALTTAAISGCSSSDGRDEPEEPIEGVQTESAEPAEDDAAAAETELADLYDRYWAAVVQLENGAELDPALFDGITTQRVTESELVRVRAFRDNGIQRAGEPVIENVTIEVDGESARIESCKNEADWDVVTSEGEAIPGVVPEELLVPHPHIVTAERSADGWLISETLAMEEARISCS